MTLTMRTAVIEPYHQTHTTRTCSRRARPSNSR